MTCVLPGSALDSIPVRWQERPRPRSFGKVFPEEIALCSEVTPSSQELESTDLVLNFERKRLNESPGPLKQQGYDSFFLSRRLKGT